MVRYHHTCHCRNDVSKRNVTVRFTLTDVAFMVTKTVFTVNVRFDLSERAVRAPGALYQFCEIDK